MGPPRFAQSASGDEFLQLFAAGGRPGRHDQGCAQERRRQLRKALHRRRARGKDGHSRFRIRAHSVTASHDSCEYGRAKMSKWTLPPDPKLQKVVVQAQTADAHRRREMGVIGAFIGGGAEKPGNVAYFAIVFSFCVILALCCAPDCQSIPKRELFTLFGGIVTSALGFLFGRSTSR